MHHARIQRGGRGSGPPPENHKNIGYLSNTGPDPLKSHKATKPLFNGRPLRARLSSLPSATKKSVVKVRPHLTKLPGSAHVHMISGVVLR